MRVVPTDPPREFGVGRGGRIRLKDCGRIRLESDEQVTFVTEAGGEYDVVRKSWGFYATPSRNGRLPQFGLRAALVKSPGAKFYVFLVEREKEAEFRRYLDVERHAVVCWLDNDENLLALERGLKG
jgi:hypothetical protein